MRPERRELEEASTAIELAIAREMLSRERAYSKRGDIMSFAVSVVGGAVMLVYSILSRDWLIMAISLVLLADVALLHRVTMRRYK